MKILLIGSGGREHALAWKIAQSPLVTTLYAAPGNPGMAALAGCVPIDATAIDELAAFAVAEKIDLVVVGPEAPLTLGLADRLRECGIAVFGPSQAAARLEGSKAFMKDTVRECGVKTAAYGRFTDAASAGQFIRAHGAPIVVKTDGLAAGKGVVIAQTIDEAIAAANGMLSGASFGTAGLEVVIEEFLEGEEISFFALCDGKTAIPFGSAQDHKRAFDGDKGPNTGGMGAYSPARLATPALEDIIMRDMIAPTLAGMAATGAPFSGVLFAGLMVKDGVPTLLEYNVRFGDPECQTLMRRLESDIVPILDACARGTLAQLPAPVWSPDPALTVVMAANGYPGAHEKGSAIKGLEKAAAASPDASVFHAGTARDTNGQLVANGGRVLNVTATGKTVAQAREAAYAAVDAIDWPEGFCRRDIAWRALA